MTKQKDKPTVTRDDIRRGLAAVGLEPGDCVIVHSSLSRFGYVEGGPDAVVDAVLDAIGPEGTAVFPNFTGSQADYFGEPHEENIYTGVVGRAARRRDDFVNSRHPLYAICAKGPMAAELVALCDRYIFAAGETKFIHVMSRMGGKALLLGVDHNSNSSVHLIEEFGDLEYKIQDKSCWALTVEEFRAMPEEKQEELRELHSGVNLDYDTVCRFDRMDAPLKREGVMRVGRIGAAEVRLMKIADVVRVGLEEVKRDPWFLRAKVKKRS